MPGPESRNVWGLCGCLTSSQYFFILKKAQSLKLPQAPAVRQVLLDTRTSLSGTLGTVFLDLGFLPGSVTNCPQWSTLFHLSKC